MTSRTRSRFSTYSGVRIYNTTNTPESDWYYASKEDTSDRYKEGDNAPFNSHKISRSGGLITGGDVTDPYQWFGYPATYCTDAYVSTHLTVAGIPSNGEMATSVIARTNPERAETSGLEYLSELPGYGSRARDLWWERKLLLHRHISKAKYAGLKRVAKLHLMIEFGLMPLLSDIELLLDFQASVDRRMQELLRLRTRGLRRTVKLGDWSDYSEISGQFMHTQGATLRANVVKQTRVEVKGHIRWYPVFTLGFPTDNAELRRVAKKAILGARLAPDTIWEVLPWSWLSDYFLNLGTMLKTSANTMPMVHDAVRIMRHSRTFTQTSAHSTTYSGRLTMTPLNVEVDTKSRVIATPTISALTESLTAKQWSILGALAAVRG